MNRFQWPANTKGFMREAYASVLWELRLGGPVDNPEGRASRRLAERINERAGQEVLPPGSSTLRAVVNNLLINADSPWPHMIERTGNSKRTYRLALLPDLPDNWFPPNPFPAEVAHETDDDRWIARTLAKAQRNGCNVGTDGRPVPGEGAAKLRQMLAPTIEERFDTVEAVMADEPPAAEKALHAALQDSHERAALTVAPEPEPEPEHLDALIADLEHSATTGTVLDRLVFAQQAISESLLDVARMEAELAAGIRQAAPDDSAAERLASVLDENGRLRKKLAAANETAVARVKETEALRQTVARMNGQIARLQANLDAAMKGDRAPDTSGFRAIDGMMRERPRVRTVG